MNITIAVTRAQVVWADQDFNPLNTTDGILTFNEIQVSNAGVYTCDAIINDTLGESAMIEGQYTLIVESKSLYINIFM